MESATQAQCGIGAPEFDFDPNMNPPVCITLLIFQTWRCAHNMKYYLLFCFP